MKRLLAYVGSFTLLTTSAGSAISCVEPNIHHTSTTPHYQTSLAALNSQVAKIAYVSDQQKYDLKYLMYYFTQPMYLKDLPIAPDEHEDLDQYNRYAELFNRYYPAAYLASDLKTNLTLTNTFKPAIENKMVSKIANLGSEIFKIIATEGLPGLLSLITNSNLLNEFLSPTMLQFANEILDQKTLRSLRNAFDDSIYQGMTYQETLTSGMIGLVNATNQLTGQKEEFDYRDKTNLNPTADNYQDAFHMFGKTVVKMMNQEIDFKFNLINNLTAISEVIRFARLVLNYLQQFDALKAVTWTKIIEIRTKEYTLNSKIDFQKITGNLSAWLSATSGQGLRSLIAILFQSSEHHQIAPSLLNNIGFLTTEDLTPAGLSVLGKVVITASFPLKVILTVYTGNLVWDLIDTMAASETLDDMAAFLNNDTIQNNLPENIKPVINKIINNPTVVKDLFVELYQGDTLGAILSMLIPNSPLAKIKNLKMVLTEPLQNWLPNNEWTNFISDQSITTIMKDLTQAITKPAIINAQDVYNLFDSFLTPTANNSWLLQDALLNADHFLTTLGFKNNIIVAKSPLFYLEKILNNITGIAGVFTTLNKYLAHFDESQNAVFKTMHANVAKVKVSVLPQPMENVFVYQIDDKTITITVSFQHAKYLINEIIMH